MNILMQQILAGVLILGAVTYVGFHYWKKQKVKSGCAACKALEAVQTKSGKSAIK
ncbi:MAG: hypothetical protein ACREBV_04420 [Candidatus Zixiibacteriota bacterium]